MSSDWRSRWREEWPRGPVEGRTAPFLARDGPGRAEVHQDHKACFFASDLEALASLLDDLADEPGTAWVKVSTAPRDGVYLGRAFCTSVEGVIAVWQRFKAHPRLHCCLQDDGLVRDARRGVVRHAAASDPVLGPGYASGAPVLRGHRVSVDGHGGRVVEVCAPGTELARDHACEESGGLLVLFDDGVLALLPFGHRHVLQRLPDDPPGSA